MCCFLVQPHLHLVIFCSLCMTNMHVMSLHTCFVGFVVLGCAAEFTNLLCFSNSFCFLSCFFSLFVIHGTLSFVLDIFWGTNSSRALSNSVMRSFHIQSIGVSTKYKAMTVKFDLPQNLLVSYWRYAIFNIESMVCICRDFWCHPGVVHTSWVVCKE